MAKLPCPPELWPAFSALLDEALDLPESDRHRWLAALGAEHAAVRPWLHRVIEGEPTPLASRFMRGAVAEALAPTDFVSGQPVGPYVLKQRLGSGGMGEVWLASRSDGSLSRQVALKLPHAHLMAGVLRRRFERERDILAGLSHPHIAQLYDAGVADSQFPYLAMEWVDGVSINGHCRDAKLTLERRLDLFLQILDAVAYAHGRLIAHRDLKPSNILVTRDGRVKLLDFGIAKLIVGESGSEMTQLTRVGSCLATPGYAAPEQLAGRPVTVAVDLYALGVVLHELLTGRRPHRDPQGPAQTSGDPARASSQIEPGHGLEVGGLEDRHLRRALVGDLDAIIAKALAPKPENRYRSAEAFAQDINRSRQHRPISARRISALRLTVKFVRRHWVGTAMSTGLVLALIGGSAGIAWQAVRAEREAQRATAIKDFLVGVFRASDPRIAADKPRGEITGRELLDVSAGRIESGFERQPATEVELLGVTADIYRELDESQRSTALYRRESELARRYFGTADPHAIDGLLGQADNADSDGDDDRALQLLAQAEPDIHKGRLDNSAVHARWLLIRGEALMNDAARIEEAQASLEAAAQMFQAVAPRDPRYPDSLIDLGVLSLERSKFVQSAAYYRRAIAATDPASMAEGNIFLANAGLALALKNLGDFDGAAAAFERGTQTAARTFGIESRHYWVIASDWAEFRYARGDRQALAEFERVISRLPADRAKFRNASDALEAGQVMHKFGRCLTADGQSALAVQWLERARSFIENSAPHLADIPKLQLDLASAYAAAGRTGDARSAFLSALTAYNSQPALAPQLGHALERWGQYLLTEKDTKGAAMAFEDALRLATGHLTASAVYARAGLAAVAASHNDVPAALRESEEAMIALEHIEGHFDVRLTPYVWGIRAQALLLAGRYDAGLELAQRRRDAALRYFLPGSGPVSEAEALLSEASNRAAHRGTGPQLSRQDPQVGVVAELFTTT